MNILVTLFFLHNVLATAFLGGKFYIHKDTILKNFGIALLLNSVAFAIWSIAILQKPDNLDTYVTYGVAFFIAALIFLVNTGIQNLKSAVRMKILMLSASLAVVLFYFRTFIYPSQPSFSAEGLFFFNIHPLIQMFYIFGLVIAALPAINMVAAKFKGIYATIIRFGFLVEVIGGIILITTKDTQVLYLTGWIMGTAYIALWAPLLLNKKAFLPK